MCWCVTLLQTEQMTDETGSGTGGFDEKHDLFVCIAFFKTQRIAYSTHCRQNHITGGQQTNMTEEFPPLELQIAIHARPLSSLSPKQKHWVAL